MTKTLKWLLGILAGLIIIALAIYFVWSHQNRQETASEIIAPNELEESISPTPAFSDIPAGDYYLDLKDSSKPSKKDLYLKDRKTDQEIFFAEIDSTDKILNDSWNGDCYLNGSVYIYAVNSKDEGEIWQYSRNNTNGTKLYTGGKGLGFLIDPLQKHIAVIPYINDGQKNGKIVLLDGAGKEIKTFTVDASGQVVTPALIAADEWKPNFLLASKGEATITTGLYKIDLDNLSLKEYAFTGPSHQYLINDAGDYIIWSDYPFLFDVDSVKDFEKDKTKVTLSLYNLKTGKSKTIASTGGKNFDFQWIDDKTFSYTDPNTNQTVQKSVDN